MPADASPGPGPGLFIVFGICGIFVFLILRALGELVLYRPSSGSFVSYAREFFGEKVAYAAGWMYFLNWAMTGDRGYHRDRAILPLLDIFQAIPQWLLALVALIVVLSMNLISVKLFGELEFWAALVKVLALITFLIVGTIFLAGRFKVDGHDTGPSLWTGHGGLFPTGLLSLVLVTSGVVFAYAAIELVGIAAGETAEPEKIMPRAINSVVFRIAVFYIGSTVLLGMLLPYTAYQDGVSPFVTFFDKLGISWGDDLMNLVVLTAALSSLNAGLYSTGRILRSMSMARQRPEVHRRDVEERRALRRHSAHRRNRSVRHRAQRLHPETRVRNRAAHRRYRRHRGVGDDRGVPAAVPPSDAGRPARAAQLPDAAVAVYRLCHARFPGGRADPDDVRRGLRPLDDRRHGGRHPGAHRRLVRGPPPGAGGRRSSRRAAEAEEAGEAAPAE